MEAKYQYGEQLTAIIKTYPWEQKPTYGQTTQPGKAKATGPALQNLTVC